ncbi:glutamate synthase subunit beta [Flavobacterium rhizosphaerae]|uniref:Glutamate synthase subunit beta n=1 Tax=Flavobacterium rhizosphaerae TaxID=3163298 RepID=A0ABW8YU97_9FLAO
MKQEKITGFKEYERELPQTEPVDKRIQHYKEFTAPYSVEQLHQQSARCMDCGVPFCHSGCPLGNVIPEFNDAVFYERWEDAYEILSSTNNFPEFTGRICPAPCESSCVLNINRPAVAIEAIEKHIIEIAFDRGLVKPFQVENRSGKSVAIIGSGPAGMAAADQLNAAGHSVTVFEKDDAAGGLLRYGIPDFKLEKNVIDRRIELMEQSGIKFTYHAHVGVNIFMSDLLADFDAVVLACGAMVPRDLDLPGRDAKGIYYAMEFLKQQNKRIADKDPLAYIKLESNIIDEEITAKDKDVVIIGSGDTGSDCVGTAIRQGAKSVTQLALMHRLGDERPPYNPWPEYPDVYRTSSSQEEGAERLFATATKEYIKDKKGNLKALKVSDLHWEFTPDGKRLKSTEIEGTERIIPCDMALISIGFSGPEQTLIEKYELETDIRGNVLADEKSYKTSHPKLFTCGDMRRGQSLVVWAITEGRECARSVDSFLGKETSVLQNRDASLERTAFSQDS